MIKYDGLKKIFLPTYVEIFTMSEMPAELYIFDNLGGFDHNYRNKIFDHIQLHTKNKITVICNAILKNSVKNQYPELNFQFEHYDPPWQAFNDYISHPTINYENFLCSFNGAPHVSRKLLVSILHKFGYFKSIYCSKNFSYNQDMLDGHIVDAVGNDEKFYRKFFISDDSDNFFESIYSFGLTQYDHEQNIYNLESKLTKSFLHIASETTATSYQPFVTEKFLYSIVTRGLFLSYAPFGWHEHIEKYYGFKLYTKLFDYRFDTIANPVKRLVELITMISKFSHLTPAEWHDLYQLEQDTIEYNYNHYFSKKYLEHLRTYSD